MSSGKRYAIRRSKQSFLCTKLSMANEVNRFVKRTVCQMSVIPIKVDRICQYTHHEIYLYAVWATNLLLVRRAKGSQRRIYVKQTTRRWRLEDVSAVHSKQFHYNLATSLPFFIFIFQEPSHERHKHDKTRWLQLSLQQLHVSVSIQTP